MGPSPQLTATAKGEMTMTRTKKTNLIRNHSGSHTVNLWPGESLWDAKLRWEKSTGRRGLVLIR